MSKTASNVLKFVLSKMEIVDTGSMDGLSIPLEVVSATDNTVVFTGASPEEDVWTGRNMLILTGTGSPQIRAINGNHVSPATIQVSPNFSINPAEHSIMEVSPGGVFTDLGFMDEVPAKLTLTPILDREAGGSEITRAYEAKLETSWMEVLALDPTFQSNFQNKKCWIKATGNTSGQAVWFKNFMMNIAVDLDLSAKGKPRVKLTGTGIFLNVQDAVVIGMS